MAWIGRVCDELRTFNMEEHIEEVFQFVEEKVAVLGQTLRVLCLDAVDDFATGLLNSEDANTRMTKEEGIIMCDIINNSPYVLPDDMVPKDSDAESADNVEYPNKEESSVTGSSDFDSVTGSSDFDSVTYSSQTDTTSTDSSVTDSSHFDIDGWLMFDDTKGDESFNLRHRNAAVANAYSERVKDMNMQLKVVLEKNEDILDTKLSSHSDEWDII